VIFLSEFRLLLISDEFSNRFLSTELLDVIQITPHDQQPLEERQQLERQQLELPQHDPPQHQDQPQRDPRPPVAANLLMIIDFLIIQIP
jgi:hypothetical protein